MVPWTCSSLAPNCRSALSSQPPRGAHNDGPGRGVGKLERVADVSFGAALMHRAERRPQRGETLVGTALVRGCFGDTAAAAADASGERLGDFDPLPRVVTDDTQPGVGRVTPLRDDQAEVERCSGDDLCG